MPSSKGQPKPSLHTLSREDLTPEDMKAFSAEMLGVSDRACALICGSVLDSALTKALTIKLIDLSEPERKEIFIDRNAVLGRFSNKIIMAYALGLITKEQRLVLDRLRTIRNAFAHAMRPITFKDHLVSLECKKLPKTYLAKTNEDEKIGPERSHYIVSSMKIIAEIGKAHLEQIQQKQIAKALMKAQLKP